MEMDKIIDEIYCQEKRLDIGCEDDPFETFRKERKNIIISKTDYRNILPEIKEQIVCEFLKNTVEFEE